MAERNPFRQSRILPPTPSEQATSSTPPPAEKNPFRQSRILPTPPVQVSETPDQWSVDEVCVWLGTLGLGFLASKFRSEDVIGGVMLDMTEEDFIDCLNLEPDHARIICVAREKIANRKTLRPVSQIIKEAERQPVIVSDPFSSETINPFGDEAGVRKSVNPFKLFGETKKTHLPTQEPRPLSVIQPPTPPVHHVQVSPKPAPREEPKPHTPVTSKPFPPQTAVVSPKPFPPIQREEPKPQPTNIFKEDLFDPLQEDEDMETMEASLQEIKQQFMSHFPETDALYSEQTYQVEPETYDEDDEIERQTQAQLEELKAQYAAMMAGLGDEEDEDYEYDATGDFDEATDVAQSQLDQDLYGFGNGFEDLNNGFVKGFDYNDSFEAPTQSQASQEKRVFRGTRSSLAPISFLDDTSNPFAKDNAVFEAPESSETERLARPSISKVNRPETLMVSAPILVSGGSTTNYVPPPTNTLAPQNPQYQNPFIAGETNWTSLPVPYIKMSVHNVEVKANEGVAFCKKYALYEIHVEQNGWSWVIFRRYSQFFDLDKKLKSAGLLPSTDQLLPPKTGLKRNNTAEAMAQRVLEFQKYFHVVINKSEIRSSRYVFQFVGPFQLGDSKPQWTAPKQKQNLVIHGQTI